MKTILLALMVLTLAACAKPASNDTAQAVTHPAPLPADESEWCGWVIKTTSGQPAFNVTTGDLMPDGNYTGPECNFKVDGGVPMPQASTNW